MVDDKVEMNNDTESFTSANTNDPKNVQELTQYVSKHNLKCQKVIYFFKLLGTGPSANNSR